MPLAEDNTEQIIRHLRFALATVLPVLTVAGALSAAALRRVTTGRSIWSNIITDEDLEEEVAHKIGQATDGAVESTPLLGPASFFKRRRPRTVKSTIFVLIGAFELVARVALFLSTSAIWNARYSAFMLLPFFVWTYATLLPLFEPPDRAPLPLFGLYVLSILQAVVDVYVFAASEGHAPLYTVSHFLYIGHIALCLLGIAVSLGMPLHPHRISLDSQGKDAAGPALDDSATLGQWLTIRWFNPLIKQANEGPLEVQDIRQIALDARAGLLTRKFSPLWPKRSLLTRLFLANLGDICFNFSIGITRAILLMLQPILLHRILNALEYRAAEAVEPFPTPGDHRIAAMLPTPEAVYRRDVRSAYFFAAISFAAMLLNAHLAVLGNTLKRRMVQRARAEAVGTLYTKALKRIDTAGIVDAGGANAETRSADLGKLVSLVSVDVVRLGLAPIILDVIGETPLTIVVAGWFLYSLIGYSAFVGYATFIFFLPMSYRITTTMMAMNRAVMAQRDLRMQSVNELLQSIKFIKFSAWETRWIQRILVAREKELKQLFKAKVVQAMFSLTWKVVPIIIAAINLAWFTGVAGKQLTVAIAFPAILALAMLTNELNSIPTAFSFYGRLMAGFQRMDEFLSEDEVPDWVSKLKSSEALSAQQFDVRVGAVDGNFRWFKSSRAGDETTESRPAEPDDDAGFQLRNINVLFPRGRLSIIAGPTGSGKSSLLAALLGEMKCLSGTVLLPKFTHRVDPATGLSESVSFCTQHPWLQSKTIRENILFGAPFDAQRYNAVLEACALVQDLNQFENGDAAEVGDKGIVLSGGQKARVALARAVYARSQIVVLDDVLSAVDTHTASTLIRKCFRGPLMQGRTVILVTHHLGEILDTAAWIVKMEHGAIAVQGTPGELRASGLLAEIIKAEAAEEAKQEQDQEVAPSKDKDDEDEEDEEPAKKLVEAETKASGSVRLAIYGRYFKAASWWIVVIFVSCYLFESLADLVEQIWIKIWSESYDRPEQWRSTPFGFPPASQSVLPYVVVYISLQLTSLLLIFGGVFPSIWSSQRAARKLFNQMLDSVVRSPTRFFDKTPAGRVLNRFSKDIDQIDNSIQDSIDEALTQLIAVVVAVATVAYGIPPYIFALVILVWLHLYFARGYVPASRDLGRLSSITQSPMLTILGETLQGLTTIRAFGVEFQFLDTLFQRLDTFHSALYYEFVCDYWLRYRFDVLGAISFGISAATAIYMDLSAGLAAIVLTQAESILQNIYYGLQYYVQMETSMNAMERIEEYIELPSEPPRHVSNIPAHWPPASPGITFENVTLRYASDLEPVLRDVSFTVKPGEKIGICGRTGSGKSTLAMSLFRFVDPDAGRILVGDMNITHLGVEDLRSCLTLIPQDAVLFSGTIRENLDPFNEHTDADCLSALSMVHLTEQGEAGTSSTGDDAAPARAAITLESKVSEGGANFSAGQRQLVALARALLRNTGIMVLDESTASVDFETDRKIQTTIRERLAGKVLLTIAHRLHTVIDYDRIIVLQDGRVVEFDTPAALIAKEGGVFRGMCVQSGHFAELVAAARGAA
ncbi:hypothetical protein AURDEDRAFT_115494 [Auricularia subglabra TFB-10046 SS5]|uniref:P-loop containing nucleoside triphosphate hydrolase protein n=1 Tax=Auricularia subglabra (strain TFB-10046 / SS5) TaxID=717982 RepID=J0LKC5_AURST|nr:hypothetical protein AURDEDRAFT_115494 [Auricularia subglabra TFB-10046 SS5]